MIHREINSSGLLSALLIAKKKGWLKGRTQQDIADALGLGGRWIVCRYLKKLKTFEESQNIYLVKLENLKK